MPENTFTINPIGVIRSHLTNLADAPRQGGEGAPEAWLELDADVADAIHGLTVGDSVMLLTWLHQADRTVLQVHPRDDLTNPLTGVFATRSRVPAISSTVTRCRPMGLGRCDERVAPLEAIDGTPLVDIKIALSPSEG
ncbi:MAG: TrmO family methyltransferase [Anaerolineae bacterium]|nr:TrmO family methyltransferase [Anaerolineae bacterium]